MSLLWIDRKNGAFCVDTNTDNGFRVGTRETKANGKTNHDIVILDKSQLQTLIDMSKQFMIDKKEIDTDFRTDNGVIRFSFSLSPSGFETLVISCAQVINGETVSNVVGVYKDEINRLSNIIIE